MRLLVVLMTILWGLQLQAATRDDKAIGVMLGNPTGLNGKYWLGKREAVDAGIGLSPGRNSSLSLHSSYLWHNESAFYFYDDYALDFYFGAGARMEFAQDVEMGLRLPVGLVHNLTEQRADVFVEVAPIIDFVARFGFELHILAGGRYYF
jgi:hypothetical protein